MRGTESQTILKEEDRSSCLTWLSGPALDLSCSCSFLKSCLQRSHLLLLLLFLKHGFSHLKLITYNQYCWFMP